MPVAQSSIMIAGNHIFPVFSRLPDDGRLILIPIPARGVGVKQPVTPVAYDPHRVSPSQTSPAPLYSIIVPPAVPSQTMTDSAPRAVLLSGRRSARPQPKR